MENWDQCGVGSSQLRIQTLAELCRQGHLIPVPMLTAATLVTSAEAIGRPAMVPCPLEANSLIFANFHTRT